MLELLFLLLSFFFVTILSSHIDSSIGREFPSLRAPTRFTNFLLNNKWNNSVLPISYRASESYWQYIVPDEFYTAPLFEGVCGREVTIQERNNYMFQTEKYLTMFGINLYDAATRTLALALLGQYGVAHAYEAEILIAGKTLQFASIRGTAPCKGIMYTGACEDVDKNGACGFCYGGFTNDGLTLDSTQAYFFRMVSDVYSYEGTVDARCPEKNLPWTWNDWRPVTGENSWANMLGPLQVAFLEANKNPNGISDSSNAMRLSIGVFRAFQISQLPNGGIAYAPWNTWDDSNPALGGTASVENAASALASLKALLFVIQQNQNTQHKNLLPEIQDVITKLTNFIRSSFDPAVGYFLQGGQYDQNRNFIWNKDEYSTFAVDCQTWVISVIGAPTIDSWYGTGATLKIWQNTKLLGGYSYDAPSDTVFGVGFSKNQDVQIFSGEWSFGAVNMLRILANQLPDSSMKLLNEATIIRQAIDDTLTFYDVSINSDIVNYANRRYYIPFGWYANPLPSLASISWAVFTDSDYNPFLLGGRYDSHY